MKGLDVSAPFRELVERKLWPVALVLLAALAAIPLLLAKSGPAPVPSAAAGAPTTVASTEGAAQPVVQVADAARTDRRRSVLGSAKDPFRPVRGPKVQKSDAATGATVTTPAATGGSTGPGTSPTSPFDGVPVGSLPTAPKKVYELYSLMVRFGDSTSSVLPKANLKRLKAMPSVEEPVVIYLGLMDDRRTAVFLVDAKAVVQGDGRCLPSPDNCQTLRLKVGETSFFDVMDERGGIAQYQLDVLRVVRKKTTDAAAARRSRYATAKGGREALRSRVSRVSGHRYDPRTGTVTDASK